MNDYLLSLFASLGLYNYQTAKHICPHKALRLEPDPHHNHALLLGLKVSQSDNGEKLSINFCAIK